MARIFISYRREDSAADARLLAQALEDHFGSAEVFIDVVGLPSGQQFEREINRALADCEVMIAIIGPRWLETLQDREAAGELDHVRAEIAYALHRGVAVIPVLVGRAGVRPEWPRPDQLPADIRQLAQRQRHDVDSAHFRRDLSRLTETIAARSEGLRGKPRKSRGKLIGAMMAGIAMVTAGLGGLAYRGNDEPLSWMVGKRDEPRESRALVEPQRTELASLSSSKRSVTVFEGRSWRGVVIGQVELTRWQLCAAECAERIACKAFSFSAIPRTTSGTCRMHSASGDAVDEPQTMSGMLD